MAQAAAGASAGPTRLAHPACAEAALELPIEPDKVYVALDEPRRYWLFAEPTFPGEPEMRYELRSAPADEGNIDLEAAPLVAATLPNGAVLRSPRSGDVLIVPWAIRAVWHQVRDCATKAIGILGRRPRKAAKKRNWSIAIKSFRRFGSLLRLYRSIRRSYPTVPIFVADDSLRSSESYPDEVWAMRRDPNLHWIWLAFDVGLSAGRNALVRAVRTPFVFMMDDDWVLLPEADLDRMVRVLELDAEVDILGGAVYYNGRTVKEWTGRLRIEAGRPRIEPAAGPWRVTAGLPYRRTDLTQNWYCARTEALRRAPWDERLKITYEHIDHMLTLKAEGVRVWYTPHCPVAHVRDAPGDYGRYRTRRKGMLDLLHEKWGIAAMPNYAGTTDEAIRPLDRSEPPELNIVLLTIGHTGSRLAARMLGALGWQLGKADERYCEETRAREINERYLRTGSFELGLAQSLLAELPEPWLLKDPRFSRADVLCQWLPALAPYQPLLIWLTRDPEATEASFRRRNEEPMIDRRTDSARWAYLAWPWQRAIVSYEQLMAAASLADRRKEVEICR